MGQRLNSKHQHFVSVEGPQAANPSELNDLAGADVTQEHLDELNEAGFEVTGTGGSDP